MALGAEVVYLVGTHVAQKQIYGTCVVEITVMKEKAHAGFMGIAVNVVDASGIKRRGPADNAMNLVTFLEQELGEI